MCTKQGKKWKQDVKKSHVVMSLFCFTMVLEVCSWLWLLSRAEMLSLGLVNIVYNGCVIFLFFDISELATSESRSCEWDE